MVYSGVYMVYIYSTRIFTSTTLPLDMVSFLEVRTSYTWKILYYTLNTIIYYIYIRRSVYFFHAACRCGVYSKAICIKLE